MKVNLVCKGGGVKGIGLVGAISCLEQNGYEWENLAGTSVGAIVASLLAVGYTTEELKSILYSIDYKAFRDKNKVGLIPIIGDIIGVLFHKGIYTGNYIENFMYDKLKAKNKMKFKDIAINGQSNLKIIASDTTTKQLLVLPDDLVKYNLDPMEFDIAKAVRMSASIPFIFNPVKVKYKDKISYIVDGGVTSNFPIRIFDTEAIPSWPTFGLNLLDKADEKFKAIGPVEYMIDVIETSIYTNECAFYKEEDLIRIINIPTLNINGTNFEITRDQMELLYKSGYGACKKFLKTWDFQRYIYRHRISKK